jgi:hypothetical protein
MSTIVLSLFSFCCLEDLAAAIMAILDGGAEGEWEL